MRVVRGAVVGSQNQIERAGAGIGAAAVPQFLEMPEATHDSIVGLALPTVYEFFRNIALRSNGGGRPFVTVSVRDRCIGW